MITDIPLMRNTGTELDYDYNYKSVFEGGREYRTLIIKSFRYQSERIKKIDYLPDGHHIELWPDKTHTYDAYSFDNDINGRQLITTEDGRNGHTEGDYAFVHFHLNFDDPFIPGKLYIMGEFTNWQLNKNNLLKFNPDSNQFEATLFMKQGYYNYTYAFLENDKERAEISYIEGSHFEAENEYKIYVYYREPGTLYDQLISFSSISSQ